MSLSYMNLYIMYFPTDIDYSIFASSFRYYFEFSHDVREQKGRSCGQLPLHRLPLSQRLVSARSGRRHSIRSHLVQRHLLIGKPLQCSHASPNKYSLYFFLSSLGFRHLHFDPSPQAYSPLAIGQTFAENGPVRKLPKYFSIPTLGKNTFRKTNYLIFSPFRYSQYSIVILTLLMMTFALLAPLDGLSLVRHWQG